MDPFFIYLLKCGGIILLFFAMYKALLRQETFFSYNRYFLLAGIAVSLLLPLLVFTKTVYIEQPQVTAYDYANTGTASSLSSFGGTDWTAVLPFVYWLGAALLFGRFTIQLLSLVKLIGGSAIIKKGAFTMVETRTDVTPFSFFNYIVYHPGSYNERELDAIIEHEKIHARQWHSIDILLAHLLTVFLWFVPFVWAYKRCIAQNLEYIADNKAITKVRCRKNYQYLLLHASAKAYQPAITNNFFNSLIKKRIVMLNKNRSQQKNLWRYSVILPLLIAFLLLFNVKTVAQVKVVKKNKGDNVKVIELIHFSIDKNTTDEALEKLKKKIREEDGKFSYKNLERNAEGEITSISITFRDDEGRSVNGSYSDDDGIEPIVFGSNEDGGVFINSGKHRGHSRAYSWHSDSDRDVHVEGDSGQGVYVVKKGGKGKGGKHKVRVKKMKHGDHDVLIDEDSEGVFVIEKAGKGDKGKKHKVWVKKMKNGDHDVDVEELEDDDVIIIEKDGKGGKGKKKKVHKIKIGHGDHNDKEGGVIFLDDDDGEPLVLIDGKETSRRALEAMDTDDIEKIEVIKGDGAIEKYGKKARDGVILIKTKKDD